MKSVLIFQDKDNQLFLIIFDYFSLCLIIYICHFFTTQIIDNQNQNLFSF